ncbi:MAG: hypothetical protein ACP5QO_06035 [Clostridia bacterium]
MLSMEMCAPRPQGHHRPIALHLKVERVMIVSRWGLGSLPVPLRARVLVVVDRDPHDGLPEPDPLVTQLIGQRVVPAHRYR